jgi:hypothetical protein
MLPYRLWPVSMVIVLTACSTFSGGPLNKQGPLGNGGTPGEECVATDPSGAAYVAVDFLINKGVAPVTIDSVDLASPNNLDLTEALLVPIEGTTLIGVGHGAPNPKDMDDGVVWAKRVPAVGAIVSPNGEVGNLLAVLKTKDSSGSSVGLRVTYHDSNAQYVYQSATRLRLEIPPAKC